MWVFNTLIEIAEGEGIAIVTASALAFPVSTITVVEAE
jgi:hypothetical protein